MRHGTFCLEIRPDKTFEMTERRAGRWMIRDRGEIIEVILKHPNKM
jgi:hypothetical protein